MGLRGPKPGARRASAADDGSKSAVETPFWHRENPRKATGQDLRDLARARGIAQSTIDRLSEEKLRREIINAEQIMREDGEL